MRLDLFSGIVFAMMLVLIILTFGFLTWMIQKSQVKLMETQQNQIHSLTNLLVSKDLATFHGLETAKTTSSIDPMFGNLQPLDDESVARMMASRYADSGMDPNLAFSKDDDPLADFGGTSALF